MVHSREGRRLGSASFDRQEMQRHATFMRLLSITEAFCADRLLTEVEGLVEPGRDVVVSKVWADAAVGATGNWVDQQRRYKDWLDVKIDWKPIDQVAEGRNAIAHGLGSLTRRQLRSDVKTRAALKAAGIELVGDRLNLTETTLVRIAAICRETVLRVDAAVDGRPRGLAGVTAPIAP